jgi:hypothetical protein
MAVKKAVQCGNVEDAIEKVNDLNPEVGYPNFITFCSSFAIFTYVIGNNSYEIIA